MFSTATIATSGGLNEGDGMCIEKKLIYCCRDDGIIHNFAMVCVYTSVVAFFNYKCLRIVLEWQHQAI